MYGGETEIFQMFPYEQFIYLGKQFSSIEHYFTEEDWELHSFATSWQDPFSESSAVYSIPLEYAMTIYFLSLDQPSHPSTLKLL